MMYGRCMGRCMQCPYCINNDIFKLFRQFVKQNNLNFYF